MYLKTLIVSYEIKLSFVKSFLFQSLQQVVRQHRRNIEEHRRQLSATTIPTPHALCRISGFVQRFLSRRFGRSPDWLQRISGAIFSDRIGVRRNFELRKSRHSGLLRQNGSPGNRRFYQGPEKLQIRFNCQFNCRI